MFLGDCLFTLKDMPANSVDAVVTDPPYGLSFMGKKWDYDVPSVEIWREVLRVLKPGGYLLSFGGTRTYHRMVVNIEDAGFEIRDQIQWLYGSGFPKSHDVSKGIDKAKGAEREVIGKRKGGLTVKDGATDLTNTRFTAKDGTLNITAPSTDLAKQWQGWGTALKPANEPICLARKPLEGTVAQNVEKWGVGGLNIDGTRIGTEDMSKQFDRAWNDKTNAFNQERPTNGRTPGKIVTPGRWPANIILDETAAAMLGEPSKFFYCAKASKSERNAGLEGEIKQKQGARPNSADSTGKFPDHDHRETGGNNHPTVKPIKLMEYLCKLICPPNGVILDPFMGSGSTGVAAKNLGFQFVGIEMNPEYFEIAKRRVE